jgi:hypothetical protein
LNLVPKRKLPQDESVQVFGDTIINNTLPTISDLTPAHKDITTGIHGVGASVVASTANISTHAALTTGVHGAGANTILYSNHDAATGVHGVGAGTVAKTSDIPSFAAPALTLGTANSAGAASTVIRSDATILAFDATHPAALGTAAEGTATTAARRDHVHPAIAATQSVVTGSRALDTVYQNTTGKILFVSLSLTRTANYLHIFAYCDTDNPPTALVAKAYGASDTSLERVEHVSFVVPNNYYYNIETDSSPSPTVSVWTEWTIG